MDNIPQPHPITALPYVKQGKKRFKAWSVKPSGDHVADMLTGQDYGEKHIEAMRDGIASVLFTANVVDDMPRPLGSIEKGFLRVLSEKAAA